MMKDEMRTKKELIAELNKLRASVVSLSKVQNIISSERRRNRDRQLQFMQNVINCVPDSIYVVGTDFQVKLLNRAAQDNALQVRGPLKEGNQCYQMFFGLDEPCDGKGYPCPLIEVLESGNPVHVEQEREIIGGVSRIFEIHASPLIGDNDELLGIVESVRDITEKKQAVAILKNQHERLEKLVRERTSELAEAIEQIEMLYRVCPTAVFTVDMDGKTTSWNDMAEKLTGFGQEEMIGIDSRYLLGGLDDEECCCIKDGPDIIACEGMERRLVTKNGESRIISLNFNKLVDEDESVTGGIGSFVDITEQKRIDNILRGERDKFKSMLTALGQGVHIVNKDYDIEFQNDVLRDIFGNKIGEKCYRVYKQRDAPCDVCRMSSSVKSRSIWKTEIVLNNRHYEQCYAPFTDVDGEVKSLILLRDITEEKMVEAETMRAAQLASLGELAAGVAHEINNPINGIINYAQLLVDEAVKPDDVKILDRIIKEGERIAIIVRNLLFFARQREKEVEDVSVSDVINDSLALILHQFKKDGIILETEIPPQLAKIHVNPQQMQQVFLNLFSNARYALNQRYKGRSPRKILKIECTEVIRESRPYVRIKVIDKGIGIPEEIIGNIFDPFFSSKAPGEGTGLGLSISHGLIRDFGGFLGVESVPGDETTFIVDLPVFEERKDVSISEKGVQ